jgi:hypothetical protein
MEDYIKKSIFDFLFYGKKSSKETKIFSMLKHNDDLVPSFNDKLNDIFRHFDRYRKVSYDIQGIRDKGIDVLAKYEFDDGDRTIGVQIKSYHDLENDGWLIKLKAQVTDVIANYTDLEDFYIAFCTDVAKHNDKIRNATADLAKIKNIHLHIIRPEQSLYFMNLQDYEIGSYLKRKLSEDDPVVIDAKESLERLTLAQTAMVIEAAAFFIENGKKEFEHPVVTESLFVREVYENYPNIPSDLYDTDSKKIKKLFGKHFKIDEILDFQSLNEGHIDMLTYTEEYAFNHELNMALISIMYDARARLGYDTYKTKWYTINLLKDLEIEIANKVKNRRID